jgi:hypothetical protein
MTRLSDVLRAVSRCAHSAHSACEADATTPTPAPVTRAAAGPLLVAESDPRAEPLGAPASPLEWLSLASRRGAFQGPRGEMARAKLSQLGLEWDWSLNLLPPRSAWDPVRARETAVLLARSLSAAPASERPRRVILVGRRVADAFGAPAALPWGGLVPAVMTADSAPRHVVVPHPSGLSRVWNDEWEVALIRCRVAASMSLRGEDFPCAVCGQPTLPEDACAACGAQACFCCRDAGYHGHGQPCLGVFRAE